MKKNNRMIYNKGDKLRKVAIISSLDYELFGDGTGDVQREQIIPTAHISNIYDFYGAKLTIMFEYGQFLAYKRYADKNPRLGEDNQRIEDQLIFLVKRGHDVQLHYHAQWHNAKYDLTNDTFKVDLNYVDITSLEYKEIVTVLKEGKEFLEGLIRPYVSEYECIGFRTGSWAVEDEKKLFKALKESGFKADSSVVPNVKFESEQVNFEYTNCPHHFHYWYVEDTLSKKVTSSDFIEIPIYTKKHRFAFLKYLNPKYIFSRKIVSSFYTTKISEKNFSLFQKIKKIVTRDYYMADFNTMTYQTLIKMVEDVIEDSSFSEEDFVPIMFIAHSKTTYNVDDLHLMFTYLEEKYGRQIEYWGYQKAIEYLLAQNKQEMSK